MYAVYHTRHLWERPLFHHHPLPLPTQKRLVFNLIFAHSVGTILYVFWFDVLQCTRHWGASALVCLSRPVFSSARQCAQEHDVGDERFSCACRGWYDTVAPCNKHVGMSHGTCIWGTGVESRHTRPHSWKRIRCCCALQHTCWHESWLNGSHSHSPCG